MKGFGFFVGAVLLLSCAIAIQAHALEEQNERISGLHQIEAAFIRLGTLKKAIRKTNPGAEAENFGAWRTAVQTTLAEEYGVAVFVNSTHAAIIASEPQVLLEFPLYG
jgi:hypothetical protein